MCWRELESGGACVVAGAQPDRLKTKISTPVNKTFNLRVVFISPPRIVNIDSVISIIPINKSEVYSQFAYETTRHFDYSNQGA